MSSSVVPGASKCTVARSWKACAAWAMATIVSVCLVLSNSLDLSSRICTLIWLVALLCAQAFLAESIGIRASEGEISFPRRLFPLLAFPVLWRRRIPRSEISRVDSLDEHTVRLYLDSTERLDLLFPKGEDRRRFAHFLELSRQSRPCAFSGSHAASRRRN
jgi:hypothetical protein